ncbi:MAG: HNH endonuclease [bacterium]
MAEIYLKSGHVVLIDDNMIDRVSYFNWNIKKDEKSFYVHANIFIKNKYSTITIHRLIMGEPNAIIDHKNGNRLDNRMVNLRISTFSQNSMNRRMSIGSSKYKGVAYCKQKKKFVAYISYHKNRIHLGTFDNEINAAIAYNNAAIRIFGEFACLNIIPPIN